MSKSDSTLSKCGLNAACLWGICSVSISDIHASEGGFVASLCFFVCEGKHVLNAVSSDSLI